jgi:hypothetical protein
MSWENIVKARPSASVKVVWPVMKNLIDDFFESREVYEVIELRNYLISNLKERVENERSDLSPYKIGTSIAHAMADLQNDAHSNTKYMDQKVPRYIRARYNRARYHNGETYELLDVEKSWDSTLKTGKPRSASRKLIEQTIKEMLKEFLEGKDEVSTPEIKQYIIDNLKEEHIKRHNVDGKVTSAVAGAPTRYINNRLDNHLKNKIPIMIKKLGYENKYANPFQGSERQLGGGHSYFIKKSDSWESMVDSMIANGELFEAIYTAILRKFKFSSPSKEKVVAYLNANYERHPLFSNKWSTKSEGEGQ